MAEPHHSFIFLCGGGIDNHLYSKPRVNQHSPLPSPSRRGTRLGPSRWSPHAQQEKMEGSIVVGGEKNKHDDKDKALLPRDTLYHSGASEKRLREEEESGPGE